MRGVAWEKVTRVDTGEEWEAGSTCDGDEDEAVQDRFRLKDPGDVVEYVIDDQSGGNWLQGEMFWGRNGQTWSKYAGRKGAIEVLAPGETEWARQERNGITASANFAFGGPGAPAGEYRLRFVNAGEDPLRQVRVIFGSVRRVDCV